MKSPISPLSLAAEIMIQITEAPLQPWSALVEFEQQRPTLSGKAGATATFIGTMRDFNEGDTVRAMRLEHYPGMTEKHLEEISDQAKSRWDLLDILIIHRVGELQPGDSIVLVAVWSAHRADAFEACRAIMEDLKSRAPFWKKEVLDDGHRWVAKNTPGYTEQND